MTTHPPFNLATPRGIALAFYDKWIASLDMMDTAMSMTTHTVLADVVVLAGIDAGGEARGVVQRLGDANLDHYAGVPVSFEDYFGLAANLLEVKGRLIVPVFESPMAVGFVSAREMENHFRILGAVYLSQFDLVYNAALSLPFEGDWSVDDFELLDPIPLALWEQEAGRQSARLLSVVRTMARPA